MKFQKNGKLQKNENEHEKNENDDVYLVEKNLLVTSNYSWRLYNVLDLSNYNDNENNKNDNIDNKKYDCKNILSFMGDIGYDELTGQILLGIINNSNTSNLKLYQLCVHGNSKSNIYDKKSPPNIFLKCFAHHTLKNFYTDSNSTYVSTSILQLWHDNYTSPLSTSSSSMEHSKPKEHSPTHTPSKTIHMSITHNKYPFSGTPVSVIDKNVDTCCEITVVKMVYTLSKKNNKYEDNYDDYDKDNKDNVKNNVNSENLIRIVSAAPTVEGTCVCAYVCVCTFVCVYIYLCIQICK